MNNDINEEQEDIFEINDDDVELEIDEDEESLDPFDLKFTSSVNKHKLEGTHRLQKDVIFNPEISDTSDEIIEEDSTYIDDYEASRETYNDIYKHVHGADQEFEGFITDIELSNDVYEILSTRTKIDLTSNRRKPNKATFNNYYEMLIKDLHNKYSKAEIFVELTHYFTDNLFNGFKLLEKKHATGILLEMKDKGYLKDIGDMTFV